MSWYEWSIFLAALCIIVLLALFYLKNKHKGSRRGKVVLGILLGAVGTLIGFYLVGTTLGAIIYPILGDIGFIGGSLVGAVLGLAFGIIIAIKINL